MVPLPGVPFLFVIKLPNRTARMLDTIIPSKVPAQPIQGDQFKGAVQKKVGEIKKIFNQ